MAERYTDDPTIQGFSATLVQEDDLAEVCYSLSHGFAQNTGEPMTFVYSSVADMPRLVLKGHVKPEPGASVGALYWKRLLELGGATGVAQAVKAIADEAYEEGRDSARAEIRAALGIE